MIAIATNMIPDELIGNLGDTHLYLNHIEQAKEQIGRKMTTEERMDLWFNNRKPNRDVCDSVDEMPDHGKNTIFDLSEVPRRTREPFLLPTLNINTEFWPTESGECGTSPLDATAIFNAFKDDDFCNSLLEEDIQLSNYQSHPAIKAPLSN
jgi:thymidylate synthase